MVPDYYQLLEVDRSADSAALEEALARCRARWSSGTRNPKTRHAFQSYLDLIPAIRQALLSDPANRARYDAALDEARRADRDRARERLAVLVRLKAVKGGLTSADRRRLVKEAERLGLAAEDLEPLVVGIPSRPDPPRRPDEEDELGDVLDPSARKQIRLALEHLGKRDLYDVLGLPRTADPAAIQAGAERERARWMGKAQVTAEKTAWLEAVTYAQSHLGSPETRLRYDRTLRREAEEEFETLVKVVLDGLDALDPDTRRELHLQAAGFEIPERRADRIIARLCFAEGVAPAVVPDFPNGVPATAASAIESPPRADAPPPPPDWVQARFKAAQSAYARRDYPAALAYLREIERRSPDEPALHRGIERVLGKMEEIDRVKAVHEEERAARRLVAAREAAHAWSRLVPPLDPEVEAALAAVSRSIRQALAHAARARGLETTDPAAARTAYLQALDIAADLPEALVGLKRLPPPAPLRLRCEPRADSLLLLWDAPPHDHLGAWRYRLVRKRGAPPANAADGLVVAEGPGTEAVDPAPPAGEHVGYAVFTVRDDVASLRSAALGPFQVLIDPGDVRADYLARKVHLSWTLPAAAVGVRVVRKEGEPPADPADGQIVNAMRDRAIDSDILEDRVYHYAVHALYPGPRGKLRRSRGVVVSVWTRELVETIPELELHDEPDGSVLIAWRPPRQGRVRILRTPKPLGRARGEALAPAELRAHKGLWLPVIALDQARDPDPPLRGSAWYTALISWGGRLVVAADNVLSRVADPSDLRARRVGPSGRVHFRWKWAPSSHKTLLVHRFGAPPTGPDDPEAGSTLVDELEYYRRDGHVLTLPTTPNSSEVWHVRAYAVLETPGAHPDDPPERLLSPGVEPTARVEVPAAFREVEVSYTLNRGFLSRAWTIAFRTEPRGEAIPPTVLVRNDRAVPIDPYDGEEIDRFPAARDGDVFPIRKAAGLQPAAVRAFPDPAAEPEGMAHVKFKHPFAGDERA